MQELQDSLRISRSSSFLIIMRLKDNHGFMTNVGVFLVRVTFQRRDIICISLVPVEYVTLNTVTVLCNPMESNA